MLHFSLRDKRQQEALHLIRQHLKGAIILRFLELPGAKVKVVKRWLDHQLDLAKAEGPQDPCSTLLREAQRLASTFNLTGGVNP